VADLGGIPIETAHQQIIGNPTATNSGTQRDTQKVSHTFACAQPLLTAGRHIGVIVNRHRQ
jgi:hypothetical protein